METRVTTLVENSVSEHRSLTAEHGLSFYVEHGNASILFDTGQSDAFLNNAEILNIDLKKVQHVVLSHGHYDHTNGFPFLAPRLTSKTTLWTHSDFFVPKYATNGLSKIYLGPSFDARWVEEQPFAYNRVTEDTTEIAPGIFVVTDFESTHPLEVRNPRFVVETKDSFEIDDFHDEVAVVVKNDKGLVVLVGCSHPGIMNMLSTIKKRFDEPIFAVLGGTHLVEAQGMRLYKAVEYLTGGDFGKLGLSHCTGADAMNELETVSERFYRNTTGTSLLLD